MWHDRHPGSPAATIGRRTALVGAGLLSMALAGACQAPTLVVDLRAPDELPPAAADEYLPVASVIVRDVRTSRTFVGNLGRPVLAPDVPAWIASGLASSGPARGEASAPDAPKAIVLDVAIERVWCATNGRALEATVTLDVRYVGPGSRAERRYLGLGRYEKGDIALARFGAWHARRAFDAALQHLVAEVRADLRAFATSGNLPDR